MTPRSNHSTITIDEDTKEVTLNLRDYTPEEFMTFESLLLWAIARKISEDADWSEQLVADAEQHNMSNATVH